MTDPFFQAKNLTELADRQLEILIDKIRDGEICHELLPQALRVWDSVKSLRTVLREMAQLRRTGNEGATSDDERRAERDQAIDQERKENGKALL